MIEKIPFLHKQKMYNIIIEDDIAFNVLHQILDELICQGAFLQEQGCSELYNVICKDLRYTVGVDGIDVVIAVK